MAERRMFAKTIIDSDSFLDMPLSTQALYFHLAMRADDDGFINNPRKVQRIVGASDDDMKLLALKNFIIPFESGVVVIKHWRIHNYIRADRYKETAYVEERATLLVKENGAYSLGIPNDNQMTTNCQPLGIPNGNQMTTQDRLGKDRLGKDRLGEEKEIYKEKEKPTTSTSTARATAKSAAVDLFLRKVNPNASGECLRELLDFEAQLGSEVCEYAINYAIDEQKTSWSYIRAILSSFVKDGVSTMDDVRRREQMRQQRSGKSGSRTERNLGNPFLRDDI